MDELNIASRVCSDLCSKNIILCDDIPFNLYPLESMLSDMGIDSVSFESGDKAVKCF